MRWKRSPFLAAACIFGVRALAVQFGFYFHMMTTVLHRCGSASWFCRPRTRMHAPVVTHTDALAHVSRRSEPALSFPLLFASTFMSIFSVVIAFFKDIPDVKGDKGSSIQTLPVRLGVRRHPARFAPQTTVRSRTACGASSGCAAMSLR